MEGVGQESKVSRTEMNRAFQFGWKVGVGGREEAPAAMDEVGEGGRCQDTGVLKPELLNMDCANHLIFCFPTKLPHDGDDASPGGHTLITGSDTLIKVWTEPRKYW